MEPTSWQVVLGSFFVLIYLFLVIQRDLAIRRLNKNEYTAPRIRCNQTSDVTVRSDFFRFSPEIAGQLPADFIVKVKQRFANRLALLRKQCFAKNHVPVFPTAEKFAENFPKWYEFRGARFTDAISRDPPVFGCAALKSASGVLRSVVMNWAGQQFQSSTYLEHLRTFTNSDVFDILSSAGSLKILFARNPLSRFCTAWGQKFRVGGEYEQHKAEWLSSWPELEKYEKQNTANLIGFGDFVDFFQNVTPAEFNPHWNSIKDSCDICNLPFEYIVKEETLDADLLVIAAENGLQLPASFFETMHGKAANSNSRRNYASWEDVFRGIGDDSKYSLLLSSIEKNKIAKIVEDYADDFRLLGYSFDINSLKLGGLDSR